MGSLQVSKGGGVAAESYFVISPLTTNKNHIVGIYIVSPRTKKWVRMHFLNGINQQVPPVVWRLREVWEYKTWFVGS